MSNAQFQQFGPFFDGGVFVTGAKLYACAAGTTTQKYVWYDQAMTTTAPFPMVANANGLIVGFFRGLYKIIIARASSTGPSDGVLETWDNYAIGTDDVLATGTTTSRSLEDRFADWFNVKDYGATGDGVTDDSAAIEAALGDMEARGGGTLFFPAGTYAYPISPNFARGTYNSGTIYSGVDLYCDAGAVFYHTGTGNAFVIDAEAAPHSPATFPNFLTGRIYTNLTVQGNANSTNGLYVNRIASSTFVNPMVRGCSTTGSGILTGQVILNTWITPRVSVNELLYPVPLHGMKVTGPDAATYSTTQVLINPVFEGLIQTGGAGFWSEFAEQTTILGGTSEGNDYGLKFDATGSSAFGINRVSGIDMEGNTSGDILVVNQQHNLFDGVLSGSPGGVLLQGNSLRNTFTNGIIENATFDAPTADNVFDNVKFGTPPVDNSATGTTYRGCFDLTNGTFLNKNPRLIVATASLPVAAAAMDGTILIEDNGAGDRNLIVYAGGQRFRIDGGANV